MSKNANAATTKLILWVGFFLGVIISWSLLSGDSQGRVNVLHLISIYVFLPIVSLIISATTLAFGKSLNLAEVVSRLPILTSQQKNDFLRQKQNTQSRLLFFYQSQLAAVSFSFSSVIILLVLLITTDVNFVWRSTLLNAENLFPWLEALAKPWLFWTSAQPDFSLLAQTQDSRMHNSHGYVSHLGDWWKFIFAAQICYAILLRMITIFICKLLLGRSARKTPRVHLYTDRHTKHHQQEPISLAKVVSDINSDYALVNWGGIESALLQQLNSKLSHQQIEELKAGPLASYSQQLIAERWQEPQLLVVKGWEPPMGELKDYMQNGNGFLLPVDSSENMLRPLSDLHLNEWRRFVKSLPSWQVVQPEIEI